MTKIQEDFLNIISGLFRQEEIPELTEAVIIEAEEQAVLSLVDNGPYLLKVISSNVQLIWEQSELGRILEEIPYVVLKGTAASIYYSEPLRRVLGDIDLIVRPNDFFRAYTALRNAGYTTPDLLESDDRHVHFYKNGVLLELHRRFATLQTKEQESILDGWIYQGINTPVIEQIQSYSFPRLEDTLNGLVLLDHINQHLEEGIGFRQLLDWIFYVDKCLSNEKWNAFKVKADQLGLTTLAKVCAKLGKLYLGLRGITWCDDADDEAVDQLLDYAFSCGNFGHKDATDNTVAMVMTHGRGLGGFLRNLQRQGKRNWKILQDRPWLSTFAWSYQLGRYIYLGLKRSNIRDLVKNYKASQKRNKMLDDLGASRTALRKDKTFPTVSNKKNLFWRGMRVCYYYLKDSPLRGLFYELYDLYFVIRYKLYGRPRFSEGEQKNVEENVTFIYKSFNRQKQAKRLYHCIKDYYPKAKVIIADDSKEPLVIKDLRKEDKIIYLSFNSGLSKGILFALEEVRTPYVMRMDDDELLTPFSQIHAQLSYLQRNTEVDLVGFHVTRGNSQKILDSLLQVRMNKALKIPPGTLIDGKSVVYKPNNVFLAKTNSLRSIGYDPNIKVIDHHEFFYRAAGEIVCVVDPEAFVLHCHNRFEGNENYGKYRGDVDKDMQYIVRKHGKDYR